MAFLAKHTRNISVCIFFAALTAGSACAHELDFMAGNIKTNKDSESYSWQLSYRQPFNPYLGWEASWINEGHAPGHHRDGPAAQLWVQQKFFDRRLALDFGLGPYRFFDTESAKHHKKFTDVHNWGAVMSLTATIYTYHNFLVLVRANHIVTEKDISSTSLAAGIGYQLVPSPPPPGLIDRPIPQDNPTTQNELTFFYGQTIVNSFESQEAHSLGLEYRRGLAKYLDITAGWMKEGDPRLIRRNGVTVQLWPTRAFFDNRFSVGLGLGTYAAIDSRRKGEENEFNDEFLTGLVSLSAAYRFKYHCLVRAIWHRTITNYNRDTDVMMLGAGLWF